MSERLVVDASAIVDLLLGSALGRVVTQRVLGRELHAPAHFDAEVLSALARLERAGTLREVQVLARLRRLAALPIERHPLPPLVEGAWMRRNNLRVLDALYVELGAALGAPVITTDRGMAAADPLVEFVSTSP